MPTWLMTALTWILVVLTVFDLVTWYATYKATQIRKRLRLNTYINPVWLLVTLTLIACWIVRISYWLR